MIYVLLLAGGALCDYHTSLLFDLACEMAESGEKQKRFSWEESEGVLTTDYSSSSLGSVAGIVFHLTLDVDDRTLRGSFIVREADIRSAAAINN